MRILVDECAPKALKKHLTNHGHECFTVQEAGWSGKQNGELLTLAETGFDVLVTVDTNLLYQQNLAGRKIAILVLQTSSNRLDHLRQFFPACVLAIEKLKPGRSFKSEVTTECLMQTQTLGPQITRQLNSEMPQSYYRARYYDPSSGRFVSEDPIRFEGSCPNFYAYVRNNATRFTDPLGFSPQDVQKRDRRVGLLDSRLRTQGGGIDTRRLTNRTSKRTPSASCK